MKNPVRDQSWLVQIDHLQWNCTKRTMQRVCKRRTPKTDRYQMVKIQVLRAKIHVRGLSHERFHSIRYLQNFQTRSESTVTLDLYNFNISPTPPKILSYLFAYLLAYLSAYLLSYLLRLILNHNITVLSLTSCYQCRCRLHPFLILMSLSLSSLSLLSSWRKDSARGLLRNDCLSHDRLSLQWFQWKAIHPSISIYTYLYRCRCHSNKFKSAGWGEQYYQASW